MRESIIFNGFDEEHIEKDKLMVPNEVTNNLTNSLNGIYLILTNISKCPSHDKITDRHESLQHSMESFLLESDKFKSYTSRGYNCDSIQYINNLCQSCYNLFSTIDYVYAVDHEAPSYITREVHNYFKVINDFMNFVSM